MTAPAPSQNTSVTIFTQQKSSCDISKKLLDVDSDCDDVSELLLVDSLIELLDVDIDCDDEIELLLNS